MCAYTTGRETEFQTSNKLEKAKVFRKKIQNFIYFYIYLFRLFWSKNLVCIIKLCFIRKN